LVDAPEPVSEDATLGNQEAQISDGRPTSRYATMTGAMNGTIRAARPDDVNELGRVHVHAWQAAYRGVMPDEYLDGLDPTGRAAIWGRFFEVERTDRQLKVVAVDHHVVGFACFGACPDTADDAVGELFAMNLDPNYWGHGLGRQLLSEVTDDLAAFGHEAVLWVVPANARARTLYESARWVDDGARRREDVLGAQVDEMRYRITFTP
jgi:GNAT superfamily N-acetyltransferase